MSLISLQAATNLLASQPTPARNTFLYGIDVMRSYDRGYGTQSSFPRLGGQNPTMQVRAEDAENLLTEIRASLVRRGYIPGKLFRPWEIDENLYANLNQNSAWMGWEFETGWNTNAARAAVVTHTHDNWDNVCFDHEGEGGSPVEITFAPTNVENFDDGSAPALQFMQYVDTIPHLVQKTSYTSVGTHLNFSTPAMRGNTNDHGQFGGKIAAVINNSIHKLPADDEHYRLKFFGRETIYGGAFLRSSPEGASRWIECKLFRTAYTLAEFQNYLRTGKALVRIAQFLENHRTSVTSSHYVSNLIAVIEDGAEPILEAGTRNMYGSADSGYISGGAYEDDDYYSDDDEDYGDGDGCDGCISCDGGDW